MNRNIAIDGPAGAGKSTIAKKLAAERGCIYVDTGAMYRAMALYIVREGVDENDTAGIEACADRADISIAFIDGVQKVLLNGEDVSGLIRTPEVSHMASVSSANGHLRKKLVALQQKLASEKEVVMDGRDIGTVVLPDAAVKIFLTASPRTRAEHRYLEMAEKGQADGSSVEEIEASIRDRDERDATRSESPLKQAEDAVLVDSSDMTIDQVVQRILEIAENAGHNS